MTVNRRTFCVAMIGALVAAGRAGAEMAVTQPASAATKPAGTTRVELGDGVAMEFVLIPAGSFLMGSGKGESDEKPVHSVRISRAFYMATTPVTREQYGVVMGSPVAPGLLKHPLVMASCWDCAQFIRKLGAKVGRAKTFSLPTEAQWEYACRAGSNTEFCFGDDAAGLDEYGWSAENSRKSAHPVAQKKPNAWGLYDMHGNVFEWCNDWGGAYPADDVKELVDPKGPERGETSVMRGGSWKEPATRCRSSFRRYGNGAARLSDVGFRLVMAVE